MHLSWRRALPSTLITLVLGSLPASPGHLAANTEQSRGSAVVAHALRGAGAGHRHPRGPSPTLPPGAAWCLADLPATFVIEGTIPPSWARAVRRAFASWTDQPDSAMAFADGGWVGPGVTADDGVNRVRFVPGTGVGAAFVYGQGTRITGFDIEVNTRRPMGTRGRGFDLETVVRHEAGHVVGVAHSLSSGDVMFPGLRPRTTKELGPGDLGGSRALYPIGGTAPAC